MDTSIAGSSGSSARAAATTAAATSRSIASAPTAVGADATQ
ncbi:hypothetical protein [Amycolatopsis balhimycina]|nr:hypothetical protein [Amycolatopsis balhimycina]